MPDEAWSLAGLKQEQIIDLQARVAGLESAIRNCPIQPVGLLADDDGFRDRILAWHERFVEWQFDLPLLPAMK